MNKATLFIIGGLLTASFSASANVVINIPADVNILVANMKKPDIESSLFAGDKLTLPNGENQLVFKYIPTFESGNDIRKIASEAVVAKFDAVDSELDFKMPKYRSLTQAKEKIAQLDWALVNSKTEKSISTKYDYLSKDGMQYGRDYIAETQEYNRLKGSAAIKFVASASVASAVESTSNTGHSTYKVHNLTKSTTPVKQAGVTSSNIEQLKAWYKNSSEQERKAFRKWIIDQE